MALYIGWYNGTMHSGGVPHFGDCTTKWIDDDMLLVYREAIYTHFGTVSHLAGYTSLVSLATRPIPEKRTFSCIINNVISDCRHMMICNGNAVWYVGAGKEE